MSRLFGGLRPLLGVMLLVAACERHKQSIAASRYDDPSDVCPLDPVHSGGDSAAFVPPEAAAYRIPELHDCQRFLDVDATGQLKFGAAYAIYAPRDRAHQFMETEVRGNLRLVAYVVARSGIGYGSLGIAPGANCLYVPRGGGSADTLAYMTVADSHGDCRNVLTEPTGHPLPVDSVLDPSQTTGQPGVARWQWDTTTGRYYAGVSCGRAWCEIGRPGPRDTVVPHTSASMLRDAVAALPSAARNLHHPGHERRVKGWFDDQMLLGAPASELRPGPRAVVFPDSLLGNHDMNKFLTGWTTVAYVAISDNSYREKLGFRQTGPYTSTAELRNFNRIAVCTGSNCGIDSATTSRCATHHSDPQKPWWALIITPAGDSTYRCVTRRAHDNVAIPGITRWRWTDADETIWVRCAAGCCELH